MTLSGKQETFAHNAANLINFIFGKGYTCTLGETFRTLEQAKIYAEQGKGIIDSLHCKRLAIDLNIFNTQGQFLTTTKQYEVFGKYWQTLNERNRWGGQFCSHPDANHFEMQE